MGRANSLGFGVSAGEDEAEHRAEMTGTATEHETVPDCVVVGQTFPNVENDADRVDSTADQEQRDASGLHALLERARSQYDEPSHDVVEHQGPVSFLALLDELKGDPKGGQAPNDQQERRTFGPLHFYQGEGGIGAGDQEVDRNVIQSLVEAFSVGTASAVVEG